MKKTALYYIALLGRLLITHVTAAPPIAHPSLTTININAISNQSILSTHNATSHNKPLSSINPPPTPFNLYVPLSPIILSVFYTRHIPDRIEHWVDEALRRAKYETRLHPRSGLMNPQPTHDPPYRIVWRGDPDERARESTDIFMAPGWDLTWGVFADCLRVMEMFVLTYPEWDFGFEIERYGILGNMGDCRLMTRQG